MSKSQPSILKFCSNFSFFPLASPLFFIFLVLFCVIHLTRREKDLISQHVAQVVDPGRGRLQGLLPLHVWKLANLNLLNSNFEGSNRFVHHQILQQSCWPFVTRLIASTLVSRILFSWS